MEINSPPTTQAQLQHLMTQPHTIKPPEEPVIEVENSAVRVSLSEAAVTASKDISRGDAIEITPVTAVDNTPDNEAIRAFEARENVLLTSTVEHAVDVQQEPAFDYNEDPNLKVKEEKGLLTARERQLIEEMREREIEVRRMETAQAAMTPHVEENPVYTYEIGPDGHRYTTGGEVKFDTNPGEAPEVTMQKARSIIKAATSNGNISTSERQAAIQVADMKLDAQRAALSRSEHEREQLIAEVSENIAAQEEIRMAFAMGMEEMSSPRAETAPQEQFVPFDDDEEVETNPEVNIRRLVSTYLN